MSIPVSRVVCWPNTASLEVIHNLTVTWCPKLWKLEECAKLLSYDNMSSMFTCKFGQIQIPFSLLKFWKSNANFYHCNVFTISMFLQYNVASNLRNEEGPATPFKKGDVCCVWGFVKFLQIPPSKRCSGLVCSCVQHKHFHPSQVKQPVEVELQIFWWLLNIFWKHFPQVELPFSAVWGCS